MPPPAVGLRPSPTTSSSTPLSNSMAAPDHRGQQQENSNSTVFGFATEFDTQTSRVGPARTRPRMAKKKQLSGRSRAMSAQFGSGFNPFKPVSETSCDFSSCGNSFDGFSEKCVSNNGSVSQLNSNVEFKFGGENECLKSENVGFVFGAKQNEQNLPLKDNGKVDDAGFVFRGNVSGAEVNLDPGKAASAGGLGSEFAGLGNANLTHCFDCERSGNVGFKFRTDEGNLGININSDMGETNGRVLELETGDVGCMFGVAQNNVIANARVAASSFSSSTSSFDEEKIDFGGASKNYVSDHTSRVETESEVGVHKVKETKIETEINGNVFEKESGDNGLFMFGRNSKQNLSFGESVVSNRANEVNASSEAFENPNRVAKCDSTVNGSCNQESTSNTYLVFSLQDEMKRLNVNDLKHVDKSDEKKSEMDDATFVFRSSNGASTSSNGNPKTSYVRKKKGLAKCTMRSDGSNRFKHGSKNGLVESADDSVGISNSESFTFQVGTGKSSAECQSFQGQVNDCILPNGGAMNNNLPEVSSSEESAIPGFRKENDTCSNGSTPGPSSLPFSDLEPPKWDPSSLKSSLFPDLDKKTEFSVKSKSKRDKKSKTTRGKSKNALPKKEQKENHHVDNERSAQDFQDSPGCYSPMDFSPYEESTAAEELSREIPGASKDPAHLASNGVASDSHPISEHSGKDDGTFDFNEEKVTSGVPNDDIGGYHSKEFVYGAKIPFSDFKNDQVFYQSSAGDAAASSEFDSIHGTKFFFDSGPEKKDAMKFAFSASSSLQDSPSLSLRRRLSVKKNRRKAPSITFAFAPGPNVKGEKGDFFTSRGNVGNKFEANGKTKLYSAPSTVTVQDVCETWRLRGNHAYKSGDMTKAEDFYTRGIDAVPSDGMLECCLQPLVICYSNRAATRMSLGNIRAALSDCMKAASLDPAFLKVQMRAANCHLVLGELESAMHFFNKCLESGPVVLDRRITIEAADGLQKIQKVAECTKYSVKLLEDKASEAALSGFEMIEEALSISPYSERLLELKAESIFLLRKYAEVIHLCEQTLSAAEKNFPAVSTDNGVENAVGSQCQSYSFAKLWRWRLISKSYFCLGKLEVALDFIKKLEQMASISDGHVKKIFDSSVSLAVTIRDLLRLKNTGNEAVKSGKYVEAVEHYTAVFTNNIESRPFVAVCFCNRAAAHQALGQLADAISDCSLAMALDRNYVKAVSRRATLHEMIRDYGQAASDLQRLISILEKQSNDRAAHSDTPDRSVTVSKELRQARKRLSLMEEEAKKGIPLDLYRILGVKRSDTTADIKKAYRKAALRHHPDKAGQLLARGDSGSDGELWKEIFEEVYKDADRLFKMIGEAYAVLSENTKRTEYDEDEEIRKETKKNSGYRSQRRTSDAYGNPFDFDRPENQRQNYWKTHGYSRSRW